MVPARSGTGPGPVITTGTGPDAQYGVRMSDAGTSSPATAGLSGLRGALADPGARLLGTFVSIPRVEVVELVAAAGFDLIVLDAEHGPFGIEAMTSLVAAAQGSGMYAVVRVPEDRPQTIGAVLDIGADGILVPHVVSGEATSRIVAAARFAPEGTRSLHNGVRAARYGADADYFVAANTRTAVLVMCEDAQAVAVIDDLVSVDGVDAVFVGPLDLSASMGHVGRPDHPDVRAAVTSVLARAVRAGKAGSLMAGSPAEARGWLDSGVAMVLCSVDTAMFLRALRDAHDATLPERAVGPAEAPGY